LGFGLLLKNNAQAWAVGKEQVLVGAVLGNGRAAAFQIVWKERRQKIERALMVGLPTASLELAAFGASKLGLVSELEASLKKEPEALNRRDDKGEIRILTI